MIRSILLVLCFITSPAAAQQAALPDVALLRSMEGLDMDKHFPRHVQIAAVAAVDPSYFEASLSGSKFAQQVAKNMLLADNRSPERDAQEKALAHDMANEFSHDEILSIWLQRVYLGSNCYGIEAASETLIGKPMELASLQDHLTLMALVHAPSLSLEDPMVMSVAYYKAFDAGIAAKLLNAQQAEQLEDLGPAKLNHAENCPFQP